MTAGQQVGHYVSYEQWSEALLEELLPELPTHLWGSPVLLSCDEDSIVRAGTGLGYEPGRALGRFVQTVEMRHHIGTTGSIESVRRSTVQFNQSSGRAQLTPPFLAVCAVMVLAASRMTADESGTTGAYYRRLWETLGATPQHRPPDGFDYAPRLFSYLAQWLDRDLDGRRGVLLQSGGGPSQIGCAINQCVFRQRDKEYLASFFAHRLHRAGVHFDLLRLLQVSSERHYLTKRALAVISAPETATMARSALEQAYRAWDGTVPDSHGGNSWLGTLRLSVRHVRLSVSKPVAALDGDAGFGELTPVPLSMLPTLAETGFRVGRHGDRGLYIPPTGDTLTFEMSEDNGVVWVRAPSQETVYVITRDRELQRKLADRLVVGRAASELPDRWQMFDRVSAERLPATALEQVARARPAVALAGGLRLGNGWLVGSGPRIEVGDVDATLKLAINGEVVDVLRRGEEYELDLNEGDHRVEVGEGLVCFTVHMLQRNPARPPYGELASSLDERGLRSGASREPREPFVCGAALSTDYPGPLPVLFRASSVALITDGGVGLREERPRVPRWLRAVGLDPEIARWQLEVEDDVAWALNGRRVAMLTSVVIDRLDHAAKAAVRQAGTRALVRSCCDASTAEAEQAFAALVALAHEDEVLR